MLLELHAAAAAPWGTPLLRGLDLQLRRGEVLAVLGPNGAGKTSLLNLLCGAVPLSSGAFRFGGRPFARWTAAERARAQAVLPQYSALDFPFTVEEVALLGRTPHGSGRAVDAQVVGEALQATDTATLRDRLYTRLSGGEKQRVQLARVLAQVWREEDSDTRLLLLDEPTAALDLAHQRLVMGQVRRLAAAGVAVVMVLHDFNLAARYADRCLVLDDGLSRACGPPAEVLHPALFEQVFAIRVQVIAHPADGVPVVLPC